MSASVQVCKCECSQDALDIEWPEEWKWMSGNEWIMTCADGLVRKELRCSRCSRCVWTCPAWIWQRSIFCNHCNHCVSLIPGLLERTALGLRLRAESLEHLNLQIESERRDVGMPRKAHKSYKRQGEMQDDICTVERSFGLWSSFCQRNNRKVMYSRYFFHQRKFQISLSHTLPRQLSDKERARLVQGEFVGACIEMSKMKWFASTSYTRATPKWEQLTEPFSACLCCPQMSNRHSICIFSIVYLWHPVAKTCQDHLSIRQCGLPIRIWSHT